MSDESDEKQGLWYAIGDFFKRLGLKVKLILGAIIGVFLALISSVERI